MAESHLCEGYDGKYQIWGESKYCHRCDVPGVGKTNIFEEIFCCSNILLEEVHPHLLHHYFSFFSDVNFSKRFKME